MVIFAGEAYLDALTLEHRMITDIVDEVDFDSACTSTARPSATPSPWPRRG